MQMDDDDYKTLAHFIQPNINITRNDDSEREREREREKVKKSL